MEQLKLTQEWDKVFPKSDKVEHGKATFHNRYGITLAADVYVPKNAEGKLTGDNKELLIIPGASHTGLYDQIDVIPFAKLGEFFGEHLK